MSRDSSPTVYTSAISTMVGYAQRHGHEARQIFSAAHVDFSKYHAPESRMTLRESDRIAEQAFFAIGCESLGLRAGQLMSLENWG
ncbi:MAG: AraC family transcriptional regulator ligand-binding domain-containing protein [Deltaproteobacteria bacterium]|nr:AraC family transcriptional regulator ligand-binding domain-containing protein [Deltaproteobacteria bacterium]MBW2138098.1 AraC family transcriptional regulator ligand-binding domain-containing protein [Deltaproteobacteria bacterium]